MVATRYRCLPGNRTSQLTLRWKPRWLRLVTHGVLLAAGPTGYVVYECGNQPGCSAVAIDRKTGTRRTSGDQSLASARPADIVAGQLSPDGSCAVYIQAPSRTGADPSRTG